MGQINYLCRDCYGDLLDNAEGAKFDTEATCSCCRDKTQCAAVADDSENE